MKVDMEELLEEAQDELNEDKSDLIIRKIKNRLVEVEMAERTLAKLKAKLIEYLSKDDKDIIFELD